MKVKDTMHGTAESGMFEERLLAELKVIVAEGAKARFAGPGQETVRHSGESVRISRSAAPAGSPRSRSRRSDSRRPTSQPTRRLRTRTAIAITASLAVAAGAAVGLIAQHGARQARVPTAPPLTLTAFLGRAAAAARSQPAVVARPGQVFYQLVDAGIRTSKPGQLPPGTRWNPASKFRYRCAVLWYATPATGRDAFPSFNQRCPASGSPRYPGLAFARPFRGYPDPGSLPTGPAALLTRLTVEARRGAGYWETGAVDVGNGTVILGLNSRTAIVFTLIERLLEVPVRGSLRAALYEATAMLPGVRLARHVTDLAGRSAVGIVLPPDCSAVSSNNPAIAIEFFLNPVSYRFLGLLWQSGRTDCGLKPLGDDAIGFAIVRSGLVNAAKSERSAT